ncbi:MULTISPECIES: hypothetical protein [Streptomyces]
MGETRPGPDELRVREILRTRGVGPDAPAPDQPATAPAGHRAAPAEDPDGWWDRLYVDEQPTPAGRTAPRLPDWWRKKPEHLPPPAEPAEQQEEDDGEPEAEEEPEADDETDTRQRPHLRIAKSSQAKGKRKTDRHPAVADPRKSLLDALDSVQPRVRRLISNLAAGGVGWSLGWVAFAQDVCAWVHSHHPADPQSIFWYVVGLCCLSLYRRSRGWAWPASWCASVPAVSAVAGVLLYAPTA